MSTFPKVTSSRWTITDGFPERWKKGVCKECGATIKTRCQGFGDKVWEYDFLAALEIHELSHKGDL